MRSFRDIPIRRKLTVLMMLISGVVLLLVGAAVVSYELITSKQAETEDLATKAAIIGADSRSALISNNAKEAEESLAALRADPDVAVAALYNGEGKLLAHYIRPRDDVELLPRRIRFVDKTLLPPAPLADGETFHRGRLEMFRRVVTRGEVIGTVYLTSTLQGYRARLKSYAWIMMGVLEIGRASCRE